VNHLRLRVKNRRWVLVDSFTGPAHVEWNREAAFSLLGRLPFFIDFLKTAGLFDAFVADCPLHHTSTNAPKKRDVLGTAMLGILCRAQAVRAYRRVARRHVKRTAVSASLTVRADRAR
jgi:hypothetical protein